MSEATDALARVRAIIAAWPETREKISHGSPTWWGGRKTFASFHDDHHGDGRLAVWVKSSVIEQDSTKIHRRVRGRSLHEAYFAAIDLLVGSVLAPERS